VNNWFGSGKMSRKPVLKQFGDLTVRDFVEHPVWACPFGGL
jgi:hypothetical protein